MKLNDTLKELHAQYQVVAVIDLDAWYDRPLFQRAAWLKEQLAPIYKKQYQPRERIVFVLGRDAHYNGAVPAGDVLEQLPRVLHEADISNFFVTIVASRQSAVQASLNTVKVYDSVPITVLGYSADTAQHTAYSSADPVRITVDQLKTQERHLLTESKTFCMYPWIHLHAYPTGDAYPCCHAEMKYSVGSCKTHTLEQLWNNDAMRELRRNMIAGVESPACTRCYEQEQSGFFSGRQSANKHHGHHIDLVATTQADGTLDTFQMTYWDIRFSNLCNLSCRSCGHIFSSSWYQDQVKLAGPEWAKQNKPLNIAGRSATDMWDQLLPHLDYVEQIYFAGGEPLMMDEHYRILEELERRQRFDVRLIYNTNFTQTKLKDRYVFDYWRKFDSVSVGASLDAMGPRGEYVRKGTDWAQVERNREQMMRECPRVDFYISPTLSIMNVEQLPEFHRDWVKKGFIRPQDLNVNILQDPPLYRIDIAPESFKQRIKEKYQEHLAWLRPRDPLQRATQGFESAINFMQATDNTRLIPDFWLRTQKLDQLRGENILAVAPELAELQ